MNKISFFTKNGIKLKSVEFTSSEELFPAVSLRKKDQSIRINFGDCKFVYNIRDYINKEKDNLLNDVSSINMEFHKLSIKQIKTKDSCNKSIEDEYNLIMDYLIFNVIIII